MQKWQKTPPCFAGPGAEANRRIGTPSQQLSVAILIDQLADLFIDARLRERIQREAVNVLAFLQEKGQSDCERSNPH
jgi:hypothetical protein